MEVIKEYTNTPSKLKKIIRFMDGVALRYIPMFFILAIANALVLKIMFDQKVSNDIILIISKKLVEFSFAITILVLIITFIIIVLRAPLRR